MFDYTKQEKEFIEKSMDDFNISEEIYDIIEKVAIIRYSSLIDLRGWKKIPENFRKECINDCVSYLKIKQMKCNKFSKINFNEIEENIIKDSTYITSEDKIKYYISLVVWYKFNTLMDIIGWLGIWDEQRLSIINDVINFLKVKKDLKEPISKKSVDMI